MPSHESTLASQGEGSPENILSFKISNFNKVAAVLGGFLSVFGLVSYLLKEKFYLGDALVSTIAGIIFSPHATNLLRPLEYARGSEADLEAITLYFTRLVLSIQLVIAGIQLPAKYLRTEWKSLALLLGPGMCGMWLCTALLVWALVPDIPFIYALAVGSCVTPTDPVLSNSIVKGRFADKNIPKDLQNVIIAESGANDGLGYPFLFIALYLIRYTSDDGLGQTGGAGKAMGYWFGITWGYTIIMSTLYGAVVGWVFKELLHWAEKRKYIDRESFLVFAVSLALFIVGTLGMIGSDDVLASFIAGNVFNWDDWFRTQTKHDSFQPTIDMLLNVAIFAWYGAVCPWSSFLHNTVVPIDRLIFIGVLVLIFRRLPIVLALHKHIHQIEQWRQALFVGFFGPIGVSAVFYLYTSREYLATIRYRGQQRADAARLAEIFDVVVWFMVICSITVHGISIPLGKLGGWLPRTLSRAISTSRSQSRADLSAGVSAAENGSAGVGVGVGGADARGSSLPFRIQHSSADIPVVRSEDGDDDGVGRGEGEGEGGGAREEVRSRSRAEKNGAVLTSAPGSGHASGPGSGSGPSPTRPLYRIGGSIIRDPQRNLDGDDHSDSASSDAKGLDPIPHVIVPDAHERPGRPAALDVDAGVGIGVGGGVGGGVSSLLDPAAAMGLGSGSIPGTPARSMRSVWFDSSPERNRA